MPIPKPHDGESKKDFISRCAGDAMMNDEYPDNPQRLGICYTQWKNRKKLKKNFPILNPNQPVLDADSAEMPSKSKAEANYVKHPVNGHTCSECTMFRAPGDCTLVDGPILPNGHCKYWEAKGAEKAMLIFPLVLKWFPTNEKDNLFNALTKVFGKVHQTSEGIDPEDQEDVIFPIASDDTRAEVTHIAWHAVDKKDVTSQDFPAEIAPMDILVATQPYVDANRVLEHEEKYLEQENFDDGDDDLPICVKLNGLVYIIDGHHRSQAKAKLGAKEEKVRNLNPSGTASEKVLSLLTKGAAMGGGNMAQHIIGLVGPSGSHKSVVSKHLKKIHGFSRIHAGKPIKTAVRKGFNLKKSATAGKAKDQPNMKLGGAHPRAVMEAMADAQHSVSPQAISHNMRKRIIKRLAKGKSVVVDGIRTPEQAKCLAEMGGMLCRVNNGKGPNTRLPMDMKQAGIQCDHELDSSQGKGHLKQQCDDLMNKLGMPKAAAA